MNLGDLNKVWEIKPLLKKPDEDEARRLLDRIANQVQPIMRRRKWRVKLLSEFCPTNPALLGLNVNRGAQVKLRLRRPNRDWDFYPFEQVLDTMLHELCHIQVSPHNAQFYKLWDELRLECEELVAKGITGTGQGFDAPGKRLGGFSRQPPVSSLRQTALAAAVKRARVGTLLPSGPRRLGGDSEIMTALTPIQAAAMAAERRMQDDLWCGSGSHEVLDATESDNGHLEQPIDVESYEESSKNCNVLSRGKNTELRDSRKVLSRGKNTELRDSCNSDKVGISSYVGPQNVRTQSNFDGRSSGSPLSACSSTCGGAVDVAEDNAVWECIVCTLLNQPLAPICEACGSQKPKDVGSKFKTWSCKFCTLENNTKLEKCLACEQWRYSYGPPVSTRAPNSGT